MPARNQRTASAGAVIALSLVGASFAAAERLAAYPVAGGQAIRFALAGVILLAAARGRMPRVNTAEAVRLVALAAIGLAAFNAFVIAAVRRTDAGSVGVVVGCLPVVLALGGPRVAGKRVSGRNVAAAAAVAVGGAVVQGPGGPLSALGLAFALGALGSEAAFSLLAAPLLHRLGPLGVSTWACMLAVPITLAAGLVTDGPAHLLRAPTQSEALALAFSAVAVTAVAFVLWYRAVERLGVRRAGLFTGVVPVSALLTAALAAGSPLTGERLGGVAIVAVGVGVGIAPVRRRARTRADVLHITTQASTGHPTHGKLSEPPCP